MSPKSPENFLKIAWMRFEIFSDSYVESMAPIGQCVKTQDRSLIMLLDRPIARYRNVASLTVCGGGVFPRAPLIFGCLVDIPDDYGSPKYNWNICIDDRDMASQTWPSVAIIQF